MNESCCLPRDSYGFIFSYKKQQELGIPLHLVSFRAGYVTYDSHCCLMHRCNIMQSNWQEEVKVQNYEHQDFGSVNHNCYHRWTVPKDFIADSRRSVTDV